MVEDEKMQGLREDKCNIYGMKMLGTRDERLLMTEEKMRKVRGDDAVKMLEIGDEEMRRETREKVLVLISTNFLGR